jgi:DNA replication protein DnaC
MASQSTSDWLNEKLQEFESKKHCRCNDSPLHGHCITCDSRVAEGEKTCPTCEDRKKRRRSCSECYGEFYLEPVKAEITTPHRFGFCSEKCYKPYLDDVLKNLGVPPHFKECTLEGFRGYTKGLEQKLQLIRRWVDGDLATGLYLFGGVGTGKTHLGVGLLRALVERRRLYGNFLSARSFIMRCQTAFRDRKSAEEIVDDLLKARRFLILDDLGSEKVTNYARYSLLHLVDECYGRGVALVITSNVNLDALNQIDERIASRVVEMCDRLKFDEPDYRVAIAKSRVKNDAPGAQAAIRTFVQ